MDRDLTYILDMVEAIRLALSYVEGVTKDEFLVDIQCQDSVIRRLEIVGEAARRVSTEFCLAHPELPWSEMIGMRNFLAHEYDDVDLDIVWRTVVGELPDVLVALEKLVS